MNTDDETAQLEARLELSESIACAFAWDYEAERWDWVGEELQFTYSSPNMASRWAEALAAAVKDEDA